MIWSIKLSITDSRNLTGKKHANPSSRYNWSNMPRTLFNIIENKGEYASILIESYEEDSDCREEFLADLSEILRSYELYKTLSRSWVSNTKATLDVEFYVDGTPSIRALRYLAQLLLPNYTEVSLGDYSVKLKFTGSTLLPHPAAMSFFLYFCKYGWTMLARMEKHLTDVSYDNKLSLDRYEFILDDVTTAMGDNNGIMRTEVFYLYLSILNGKIIPKYHTQSNSGSYYEFNGVQQYVNRVIKFSSVENEILPTLEHLWKRVLSKIITADRLPPNGRNWMSYIKE